MMWEVLPRPEKETTELPAAGPSIVIPGTQVCLQIKVSYKGDPQELSSPPTIHSALSELTISESVCLSGHRGVLDN